MTAPEGNNFGEGNDGGAPKGNDNSDGSGGPPARNQNALRHGMYSDPDNLLEYLQENDAESMRWIHQKYNSYLDAAPFGPNDAKADQLLQIVIRELSIWRASGIQIREGVVSEQAVQGGDGEWYEAKRENPANQALSRLERDVTKRLKELGVLGNDQPAQQRGERVMESSDYKIRVESRSVDEVDDEKDIYTIDDQNDQNDQNDG